MRIQHNIAALNSYRNLRGNNDSVSKSLEKLSSGYRINRAGDDAAGLAISEKMRGQITGLSTAQKNAQDGISLVQTAEGALTEVHSMLNRMVELATQSSNGVYDNEVSRKNLQNEMDQLRDEIDRISDATNFNGKDLLDGSLSSKTYATVTGSGTMSSANFSGIFKADASISDALGGAPKLNLKFDAASTAGESTASVTAAGVINVVLGGTDVTSYSNDDINQLINDAIDTQVTALRASATAGDKEKADAIEKLKGSFTGSAQVTKKGAAETAKEAVLPAKESDQDPLSLQIGDTNAAYNKMNVDVDDMHAEALGIGGISIATQEDAGRAIEKIKAAIDSVSATRGDLGAIQNRLEHTINNLSVTTENMTAAESRVRDVDMAQEMMTYTKNNILVQSSQAMLAQANQIPQGVLQLLQ